MVLYSYRRSHEREVHAHVSGSGKLCRLVRVGREPRVQDAGLLVEDQRDQEAVEGLAAGTHPPDREDQESPPLLGLPNIAPEAGLPPPLDYPAFLRLNCQESAGATFYKLPILVRNIYNLYLHRSYPKI